MFCAKRFYRHGLLFILAILFFADEGKAQYGIFQQVYTNITGVTVANLTNSIAFPNSPASNNIITTSFETISGIGDNYGMRLRAYIIPPTNGSYVFWTSSDDASSLYLSTNESPASKVLIATVNAWTGSREWTKEANQQSNPIALESGKRYYIEVLMKEGSGGDSLAVRWQLPNFQIEEPIPATRLFPYTGTNTVLPNILQQPTNVGLPEARPGQFRVLITDPAAATYQWTSNTVAILNATNSVYNFIADYNLNGANFACRITNSIGVKVSSPGVLTVTRDTTSPLVTNLYNMGPNEVVISFSEPLDVNSAATVGNYSLNGATITGAIVNSDGQTVRLQTSTLTVNQQYTITINNLKDRANSPNLIAPNTQKQFTAYEYTPLNIGSPIQGGSITAVAGGFNVTASGSDIGGVLDQFLFSCQPRTGNFDLQAQIPSMTLADAFSKAGIMARENTDPNCRFAAILATPSTAGTFFESRTNISGSAAMVGNYPINYPNFWVRLVRNSSLFQGYVSYDGQNWILVSSVTMNLPPTILVGMSASSHDPTALLAAQFRNVTSGSGSIITTSPYPFELPGASTRKTGLVFSEIMYHPAPRTDGKSAEFIEILNSQPYFADLSGYQLQGDVSYTFPTNTILKAGDYMVIAKSPADVQTIYGINNVQGPYTNSLSNQAGSIKLISMGGGVLLEVDYDSSGAWPSAPDGSGHSLVLTRASYGENNPKAWSSSTLVGGSPGRLDPFVASPLNAVRINELLAHTDPPDLDTVELYNHSNQSVDISGAFISDSPDTNKFIVPQGTVIPARGFLTFTEVVLGFRLAANGETIYFRAPGGSVIDCIRYPDQENGVSFGRLPDGASDWYRLNSKTFGTNNATPLISSVVINELMYAPISEDNADQYLELFNRANGPADLSGWKLSGGISYTFAKGTTLGANSYLVVAKDSAHLKSQYPALSPSQVFGNFSGSMSGSGERITLTKPDEIASTNSSGVVLTNTIHIAVDEVEYRPGGRWPAFASKGGSSLELKDAHANKRLPSSWGASDETSKSGWTVIETTGVLDNGTTSVPLDAIHLFMQGAGECLVDDVEVYRIGSTNMITNGQFNSGLTGWFLQGNQDHSFLQSTGGYGDNGPCLHVVATGRGDTGANRVRYTFTPNILAQGNLVTIRAKVRWLKGNDEVLLRLRGNWLEAAGRLSVPAPLGTPGAPNSVAVSNLGPLIFDVSHFPVLPDVGQPVVVTAKVHDPDGISSLQLNARIDGGASLGVINMRDDGTGGDEIAGDGIFSATIPSNAGAVVAFYIRAADSTSTASLFPADAPTRECLVRYGVDKFSGNIPSYHIMITTGTLNTWNIREHNSNEPLDATFVYNGQRVIYNAQTMYSGSPWHSTSFNGPLGNACDYVFFAPEDDLLLGATDFVFANLGNNNSDDAGQREQFAFHLMRELGAPSMYRRHMYMQVNGVRRNVLYEDSQQPNSDIVHEWFPADSNGDLHKIEDWFEFDTTGDQHPFNADATLQLFTTTGGAKKVARYRWNWRKRAVKDSASDYTNLLALVDAVNTPNGTDSSAFIQATRAQVDLVEWMKIIGTEHFVGNWDSYGYRRGKNMYAYKPVNDKWKLLPWDIDFVLGTGGDAANYTVFDFNDPIIAKILATPEFQRIYWQTFIRLMDGPLLDSKANPLLDSKYLGFQGNALPLNNPDAIKSFIASRKTYLTSLLAGQRAAFSITTPSYSTNGNLAAFSGLAPADAVSFKINGITYSPIWNTSTNWTLQIPINSGANVLTVQTFDYKGNAISGGSGTVTINYTGQITTPETSLVISEIHYNPAIPGTSFVEIYNRSSSVSFDLSNYRLSGVNYTFAEGSIMSPNQYLLIVQDLAAFGSAYPGVAAFGQYNGSLSNGGETLSLIKPGSPETVVSKVRFNDKSPWPVAADGTGASLQLLDLNQDGSRVGNWTASTPWQFGTITGVAQGSQLGIYLNSPGDIYLDDISVVAGNLPATGPNLVNNGDFELPLSGTWTLSANAGTSTLASNLFRHSGSTALHLVQAAGAVSSAGGVAQNLAITSGSTYTLGFWYLATNSNTINIGVSGLTINASVQSNSLVSATSPASPGVFSTTLPAFPALWINEIQPNNVNGPTDNAGQLDPCIELYNSGATTIALSGLFLSDSTTYALKWAFPAGASIAAGQHIVVWLDGQPSQTTSTEWHTSFRINANQGTVSIASSFNNKPIVIDYIDYGFVGGGSSFGSWPEGQSETRQIFNFATPGAVNNPASAPASIVINEWMAANVAFLADSADGHFDDWFELYNASSQAVDLTGYTLTDTLTNSTQWAIPAGTIINAHSFILVWADNDITQNGPGKPELHANFKLSQGGEQIGLFAPDHSVVDAITFGNQTNDVSQGRFPDGGSNIVFMTRPTPKAANIYPANNSAPALAPIGNYIVEKGSNVTFFVTATDVDAPPQSLSFALQPGAPAGAAISNNGLFTWTVPQNTLYGTYTVTVRVTDNGSPAASDTRSFLLQVPSPNTFGSVAYDLPSSTMQLLWPTEFGKSYRLQYTDTLSNPLWFPVGTDVPGNGDYLQLFDQTGAAKERYYRMILLP
ncbi:MAG: CotH protein [Verrucomicrobiales bacterium]|nr:CotH protein [Verrucomicrobiales bacterium]